MIVSRFLSFVSVNAVCTKNYTYILIETYLLAETQDLKDLKTTFRVLVFKDLSKTAIKYVHCLKFVKCSTGLKVWL